MVWNCSSYSLCFIMYFFVWKINSIDKYISYKWSFICYYYYDISSIRKRIDICSSYSNSCICNLEVYWYINSFKSSVIRGKLFFSRIL